MKRIFVEKKAAFREHTKAVLQDLRESLGLSGAEDLRIAQRYDIDGLSEEDFRKTLPTIFAEPQVDDVFEDALPCGADDKVFAVEYLPGQFDQRADSAAQCVQMLTRKERPLIASALVYVIRGNVSDEDLARVKAYLINPVDSREASLEVPETLRRGVPAPEPIPRLEDFSRKTPEELSALRRELGLAMSDADLAFVQKYFRDEERREPTLTEIRVLDTYWSDHCRHTTFLTRLNRVSFDDSPLLAPVEKAWERYLALRRELGREDKTVCLMDVALLAMRELKKQGKLDDLEVSEEINAASIVVPVTVDGKTEDWLVMFKNETHNHPTEIEPFGGAATCLGGAIRDPLSGRSYVYQAMRVTGAADPRAPFSKTLSGKLPQRKIVRGAAQGYSSYGNQIGLATGTVHEIYHPGYVAKRLEIGAVIAAGPKKNVVRGTPVPGDVIVLVGGRTGRDGIGGATGSSKEHTEHALENSAEVQKGDAPTERKLQRLFRDPDVARLIKRCNDFGAGGVSVAVGELAPSLDIRLDRVPRKYEGLNGTELAISESQERMAVVLDPADFEKFRAAANRENLESTPIADVTDSGRLRMFWQGEAIVDLRRAFLDTNGATQETDARVCAPDPAKNPLLPKPLLGNDAAKTWLNVVGSLRCCGQRGLVERFDASIGAGTVLHPFGGKTQTTPIEAMAAKIPVLEGETDDCTLMSFGFDPELSSWSPAHGAAFAVVDSVARLAAAGGDPAKARLTLQEYFEKLGSDPARWGKPLAALLGAFTAQLELGNGAVGGKDSMSGSFKNLDVPPTLVSFAVVPAKASGVISPELKRAGTKIVRVPAKYAEDRMPDWADLRGKLAAVHRLVASGRVLSARTVRAGGLAAALAEMAFGNGIGVALDAAPDAKFFVPEYGAWVLEVPADEALDGLEHETLGRTQEKEEISWNGGFVSLAALREAWEAPLEAVFPTRAAPADTAPAPQVFSCAARAVPAHAKIRVAKPRVFIPVFPGSNCEYDTARAFREAGAEPEIFVVRNLTTAAVEESLRAIAEKISQAQILMIPGGFSAGDEPDGSGKFIASVFKNPAVRDATNALIKERDGLILGICNGFQALIKLGLVPFGEIRDMDASCPTLFRNRIGRHISRYVHTRVASVKSPWLSNVNVGDVFTIPASHGEGNFTATPETVARLAANGQIAFQYCDAAGTPSYDIACNPNGSYQAIEGILSPDGRVLGKMGHSERRGNDVGKNIPGNKNQPIFAAGVAYFA
ncbi:MAG TPA: phosphoribosylformylglycinamidine synthase [Candidatus Spyradosoma merdigallinarum]|uniref:Phosphoribosylformylglycinamidine synthase n=1 Tax=Candidatus Spyradosoma merdigallinarum TaxID=2840950 RepID=A0A9D1T1K1_9BACT|nr:phosphoribosylformylglycinamidine synthase [Candidatus Spyradosoma merdigallinarum]